MTITGIVGLLSQNNSFTTDNLKQSANPIDSANINVMDNLESIEQDTVLDNISKILLTNKAYKNSAGVYNEDSIRSLLYRNGIIDYQYEIQEISNKDTVSVFKTYTLANKSKHIRMGTYKSANKHILFKTKSYLKFDHGLGYARSDVMSAFSYETSAKVYTDSIFRYFKMLELDEYQYQFYDRIPSSLDKMDNIGKKKVQANRGVSIYGEHDVEVKAIGTEVDMFLIISNKNDERVVVVK